VEPAPAPQEPPTTVFGDLAIFGAPMQQPPCDGSFITIVASAVLPDRYTRTVSDALSTYQGSMYLRTDQTCPSLRLSINGNSIYSIFYGPFSNSADACGARQFGPTGSYVRRLSTTDPPEHVVKCG
jgi:hypothetical protein